MITIPIVVCGDHWENRESAVAHLQSIATQDCAILDLHAEGPSLHALGIVDAISQHVSVDRVQVINWSNSVEIVPFNRMNQHFLSHFFWMSDQYRSAVPEYREANYLFGYFVGRRTVPRCAMLHDIRLKYNHKFLLSLMNTVAGMKFTDLDPLHHWCDPKSFHEWWNNESLTSLDGYTVRDQFSGDHNTNASLLQWYSNFDIELVAETYCHGDAFFVTEKTVRPIVAGKSMLVYGPKNYLKRLRDFGFQTWNTVWDESYDTLVGPARWRAMCLVIDDLITRDQNQLYQQCKHIVKHNRSHADVLIKRYRPG
jgi:hypothetical protein